MGDISKEIGGRIRLYRQIRNLSLSEFATIIHKSKSTLSKYESGSISIDIEVLFEIADALGICLNQLTGVNILEQKTRNISLVPPKRQYLYIFDGRINRIMRSVLEISQGEQDPFDVTLFYNIPTFNEIEKCKALYFGIMQRHEFVVNYSFKNQTNPIENLSMCTLNSLDMTDKQVGLMSGISSRNFLPMSVKCIISDEILKEDEALTELLMLSREDLRLTKRFNMFIIDQLV